MLRRVCDLETSRIGAPYIYDISSLRVNWQAVNDSFHNLVNKTDSELLAPPIQNISISRMSVKTSLPHLIHVQIHPEN